MGVDGENGMLHGVCQHGTMTAVAHPTISRRLLHLVPAGAIAIVVVALAACGVNKDPQALPGKSLAKDYGCMACHTVDGRPSVGPTWKGLYGSQVTLEGGATVTVDRDYLVRSITDPNADIPQGAKVKMPVNRVPDSDVQKIVDYIISLK
jgi:cytochrome c1